MPSPLLTPSTFLSQRLHAHGLRFLHPGVESQVLVAERQQAGKLALHALLNYLSLHAEARAQDESLPVPVLLLDLDSTLFHSDERHLQILSDYIHHHQPDHLGLIGALESLKVGGHIWNPVDHLKALGISDEELLHHFFGYWRERYFSNDYLLHDEPVVGAPEFVRACHARGAFCFYLTGRVDGLMREGTRKSLFETGFPMDHRTHLHMKASLMDRDLEFKRSGIAEVQKRGQVVGIFENEPANLNLFHEAFPEAVAVFLDTLHSPKAPPVLPHLPWVQTFELPDEAYRS